MPADVPVDQPARGLDAWDGLFWLWDVFFAIGSIALVVALVQQPGATAADKVATVGALAAMAVWYLCYGRPNIVAAVQSPVRGRIFMGVNLALLVLGVAFEPTMSFALFAVCPMAFMSMCLAEAIAFVVGANLVPVVSALAEAGVDAAVRQLVPGTLFLILFSVLMGTWIVRVVTQSQERAELIQELEDSREEIGRLSREAGVAAERARLAAEIHDTLAQGFTSLVTLVQAAESELDSDTEKARKHLTLAARTARENLTEARSLVAGLMPTALGTGSVDQAIRRQCERFTEETGTPVTYQASGSSVELPTTLEVVLLRMVQESLTNIRKHAKARNVTVSLRVNDESANLTVADDGAGFDPDVPSDGFGLRGMRTRAAQVEGTLSVHSGPDGTKVELEVPR
ncbi:sensor histidine kinase [Actinophytocola sp. NPDC049390]|uniref:sensor histidine kinase n=1 Tax=Actinophytocola sp. NPDC049390 TaxID=3363894 RepID=UPI003793370E